MKQYRTLIAGAALAVLGTTGAVAQGAETGNGPVSRDEVVAELRAMQAARVWTPIQEASPTPLEAIEQEQKSLSLGSAYSSTGERMNNRVDPQLRSPNQDETRSLQNVPNQRVPAAPATN